MVTFRSIGPADRPVLASWFSDAELSRRVSAPDAVWFRHVTAGKEARAWIGLDEAGAIVCEVQVDREPDGTGFIELYIRPDLRGRGLGRLVLAAFIDAFGGGYRRLVAAIEEDNVASLACARRCGFVKLERQPEPGMIWMGREPPSSRRR